MSISCCRRIGDAPDQEQTFLRLEGAIFTGCTDTPLLRKGKRVTQDVCGTYIHTCRSYEGWPAESFRTASTKPATN